MLYGQTQMRQHKAMQQVHESQQTLHATPGQTKGPSANEKKNSMHAGKSHADNAITTTITATITTIVSQKAFQQA